MRPRSSGTGKAARATERPASTADAPPASKAAFVPRVTDVTEDRLRTGVTAVQFVGPAQAPSPRKFKAKLITVENPDFGGIVMFKGRAKRP